MNLSPSILMLDRKVRIASVGAWTMGCDEGVSVPVMLMHGGAALVLYGLTYDYAYKAGKREKEG